LQFSRCSDIGQSFALIGLHKIYAATDWLLIKRLYLGKKGLLGVQLQNLSDNSSNQRDFSIYRKDVLFQPKIKVAITHINRNGIISSFTAFFQLFKNLDSTRTFLLVLNVLCLRRRSC
jgi:hypothetical protein